MLVKSFFKILYKTGSFGTDFKVKVYPKTYNKITLNKSNHVHKKSKEQFYFIHPVKIGIYKDFGKVDVKNNISSSCSLYIQELFKNKPDASFYTKFKVITIKKISA